MNVFEFLLGVIDFMRIFAPVALVSGCVLLVLGITLVFWEDRA